MPPPREVAAVTAAAERYRAEKTRLERLAGDGLELAAGNSDCVRRQQPSGCPASRGVSPRRADNRRFVPRSGAAGARFTQLPRVPVPGLRRPDRRKEMSGRRDGSPWLQ